MNFFRYFHLVEEAAEKIIVFDSYDTVVQANLVKTKLDAYGIPCFLSEENFSTWYPFRNQLFPGVRLHIFEKDYAQVREILEDSPMTIDESTCPRCKSSHIKLEEADNTTEWKEFFSQLFFASPRKKVYRCQECSQAWD